MVFSSIGGTLHKLWRPEVEKELKRLEDYIKELSKDYPTHPFDYEWGQRVALREILSRDHICSDTLAVMEERYKKMIDQYREWRMPRDQNFYAGSLAIVRWVQSIYE